jgi:hypothetical protein
LYSISRPCHNVNNLPLTSSVTTML